MTYFLFTHGRHMTGLGRCGIRTLTTMAGRGKRDVLIVDDNEPLRVTISRMLESNDYDVELADSGVQAINAVCRRRPDLILMDLAKPQMDSRTFWLSTGTGRRLCESVWSGSIATSPSANEHSRNHASSSSGLATPSKALAKGFAPSTGSGA